jgi:thiamine kinase-like enzyme
VSDPVLDGLQCLRGREVQVRELAGGLSNRPVRVTTVDGGPPLDLVVRPPAAGPLGTDRAAEHRASAAAARAGVAPAVVEFVAPDGPLAVVHLDARPLGPEEVRGDLHRVAELCRRLHAGPPALRDVKTGEVLQRYARLVAEHGTWVPRGHAALAPAVDRALAVLARSAVPLVPCHNDLPGGNVLDDGTRLWLVDFEYAANNDPWCELGTLASGAGLSPEQVEELVTAYDDRAGPERVARTRLWDGVCSWTWVLWASLQEALGEVAGDYRGLAEELLDRAQQELGGPGLDVLLRQVAGPA